MTNVEFIGEDVTELIRPSFRQASISWMAKMVMRTGIVSTEDNAKKVLLAVASVIFLIALGVFFFKARGPQGQIGPASQSLIREMQRHIPALPLPNNNN
ncbi:MAG: hypothetical protein JWN89_318 [Parcubacteria group bacterium]|nr:hypothetical protein [Parcubacteria group bacterium]